jgi:hypothetical protein
LDHSRRRPIAQSFRALAPAFRRPDEERRVVASPARLRKDSLRQSPVVAILAGLLGIESAAPAESFAIRESSLLFVDPPVEAPTGPEGAEAGADPAFYRDAAERFAQQNGLQVSRTKAPTLLFEPLGAKPIRLKNTAEPSGTPQ